MLDMAVEATECGVRVAGLADITGVVASGGGDCVSMCAAAPGCCSIYNYGIIKSCFHSLKRILSEKSKAPTFCIRKDKA